MSGHKNVDVGAAFGRMTSAQLKARRRRLAARLADPAVLLSGALVSQTRRCGRPGCGCVDTDGHGPYTYLRVRVEGRARLRYVPAVLVPVVTRRLARTATFETLMAEISAINVELLTRRELD